MIPVKATQLSFRRVEKKYLLTRQQYRMLRAALCDYIETDDYPKSTICNVYYDTPDYLLISRSLEKPVYKEKFRLRSYGVPEEDGKVFMEIKKKYEPRVSNQQIMNEIEWFCRAYRKLQPGMFLAYDRYAFRAKSDPDLRITFDWNIRFRTDHMELIFGDYGESLFDEDLCVMEIKIPGAAPMWLTQILSELKIYPTSFSKYGRCYQKLMTRRREEQQRLEAPCYAG